MHKEKTKKKKKTYNHLKLPHYKQYSHAYVYSAPKQFLGFM